MRYSEVSICSALPECCVYQSKGGGGFHKYLHPFVFLPNKENILQPANFATKVRKHRKGKWESVFGPDGASEY